MDKICYIFKIDIHTLNLQLICNVMSYKIIKNIAQFYPDYNNNKKKFSYLDKNLKKMTTFPN